MLILEGDSDRPLRAQRLAMQPSGAIHWEIPGEPKHAGDFK
jgi:hypothetical protein